MADSESDEKPIIIAEKTNKNNVTYIFFIVIITITFIIGLILFLYYFKPNDYHEITIQNNLKEDINVVFGGLSTNGGFEYFRPRKLSAGNKTTYYASPGCYVSVQAYLEGNIYGTRNPFTTALIQFAGNGYILSSNITNGTSIFNHMQTNNNLNDYYGISLQKGFNLKASLAPQSNIEGTATTVRVVSPISEDQCPTILAGTSDNTGTTGSYQWCATPCFANPSSDACCAGTGSCSPTGSCQQSWISAYTIFQNSCPQCLITNCDRLNYTATSKANYLSNYFVIFGDL